MTILFFHNPLTCAPCKAIGKMIKDKKIEVEAIDATDNANQELLDKYGVMQVPCLVNIETNLVMSGLKGCVDFIKGLN